MGEPHDDRFTRRGLLRSGAGATVVGALTFGTDSHCPATNTDATYSTVDYASLGIQRIVNATGNVTILGGSVMPPEVIRAWVEASKSFVNIVELHDRVGARIAELTGYESALVTTGAAGALYLGVAAAVTLADPSLVERLPDTTGARNEIILQKAHHSGFDSQLRGVGTTLIEVETVEELEHAVTARTALMFFMNINNDDGKIQRDEWVRVARRRMIPTLLDASADVPPVERFLEYQQLGFDLVAISGGKAMRGPNDTGLLLGKKELIDAAKPNANPFAPTIGRMLKVGKEDMMALLAAVERFVHLDHRKEWQEMERRIAVIEQAMKDLRGVVCERIVPPIANHQPHLIVSWDEDRVKLTREQATGELMTGDPPIQIGRVRGTGNKGILISVLALQSGEEELVARRLHQILSRATE